MDLDQLNTFLILAETLSFSETALRMGVTQPVITRRIQTFEISLGKQLFYRNQRNVYLTENGANLKNQIQSSFYSIQRALTESNRNDRDEGWIKIYSIPEVGKNVLAPISEEFQKYHKNIRFHFSFMRSENVIEGILRGDGAFGLTYSLSKTERLREYKFIKDETLLVGPPDELDIDKMIKIPLAVYWEDDLMATQFLKLRQNKKLANKIKKVFIANSHDLLIKFAVRNKAFCIIQRSSCEWALKKGKLKIYTDVKISQTLNLITQDRPLLYEREKLFFKFLMEKRKYFEQ